MTMTTLTPHKLCADLSMKTGHAFTVGDRVDGGHTPEDYDTGRVVAVEGDRVTVAWDGSLEITTQSAAVLRPLDHVVARKTLGWTTIADARQYASDQVVAFAEAPQDAGRIDSWIEEFARACWDSAEELDVGRWIEDQLVSEQDDVSEHQLLSFDIR